MPAPTSPPAPEADATAPAVWPTALRALARHRRTLMLQGPIGWFFDRLAQVERWIRLLAGVLFILAGTYYCLTHIYGLRIRW